MESVIQVNVFPGSILDSATEQVKMTGIRGGRTNLSGRVPTEKSKLLTEDFKT